jgi:hypothetical protein
VCGARHRPRRVRVRDLFCLWTLQVGESYCENGLLCVGAFSSIPGLRAEDPLARRARAEILWHYGAAFWA